ncbi:V-type proton ATPase subunit G 3 [Varanus komodoensis]|uniref:V-type proton ATPase subunit G n=1 Tax=Varanus komodoensis TaxID=61221 RepID=A0A8D2KTG1_VARKO|nr:V-type proton ATPase subunit G 3 [Varanus komodoensis]KAF7243484.1 V-type proton ATPase subunit G 3 [Varanus komodoensis]
MTSQSQGIQQLLQAEKRAKDKLEEAKKRKGKRLRQAKEEATAEIDHYRLQREKDFRHKQTHVMGSQGDLSVKVDDETSKKIQELTRNYHHNKESVIGHLLDKVYNINPQIHSNYAYTI